MPSCRSLGRLSSPHSIVLGVFVLALVPRALSAAASFITTDERLWLHRSAVFAGAISDRNWSAASAGQETVTTMPGVTTMWLGTAARAAVDVAERLGVWTHTNPVLGNPGDLTIGRQTMALATSGLVALTTLLIGRWLGWVAAGVTGVLLATEPFFVAHGALLHTDELLCLFGVSGLVAMALFLGIPNPTSWAGKKAVGLQAGSLWAGAWLTKASAAMFLPGICLMVLWSLTTSGGRPRVVATIGKQMSWWTVGAGLTILTLYPALWVTPVREMWRTGRSAGMAIRVHDSFFMGRPTATPGPAFYFVSLPLRMTPWFLLAGAIAVVAIIVSRQQRSLLVVISAMALPPLVIISVALKQFDRYGLPVLAVLAIAVGAAVSRGLDANRGLSQDAKFKVAGVVAVTALGFNALIVAPWGLGYFNPLLGGADVAKEAMLVGWGEGLEGASELIAKRETKSCEDLKVWVVTRGPMPQPRIWPCGHLRRSARANSNQDSAYVVVYISAKQRLPKEVKAAVDGRVLVGSVNHRGVRYAEVYGPRQ